MLRRWEDANDGETVDDVETGTKTDRPDAAFHDKLVGHETVVIDAESGARRSRPEAGRSENDNEETENGQQVDDGSTTSQKVNETAGDGETTAVSMGDYQIDHWKPENDWKTIETCRIFDWTPASNFSNCHWFGNGETKNQQTLNCKEAHIQPKTNGVASSDDGEPGRPQKN